MLITKDNLSSLKVGQKVYKSHSGFRMLNTYTYLGIHQISHWGNRHIFYNVIRSIDFSTKTEHLPKELLPDALRRKELYTTYAEACKRSREQALDMIEHYNQHYFKENPIKVETDEKKT